MVKLPQKTTSKNHSVLTMSSQTEHKGWIEIKGSSRFLNKGNLALPGSVTLRPDRSLALVGKVWCCALSARHADRFVKVLMHSINLFNNKTNEFGFEMRVGQNFWHVYIKGEFPPLMHNVFDVWPRCI